MMRHNSMLILLLLLSFTLGYGVLATASWLRQPGRMRITGSSCRRLWKKHRKYTVRPETGPIGKNRFSCAIIRKERRLRSTPSCAGPV